MADTNGAPSADPNAAAPDAAKRGEAPQELAPEPEHMDRPDRTYGSDSGVDVGDIVEVWLDGAWSDEPFTVVAEVNGKYVVKQGVAGAPDFSLPGEPPWSPSVHCGLVPDAPLCFPDEVRAGTKFSEVLNDVPVPSSSRTRVLSRGRTSVLIESAQPTSDCADKCNAFLDACLECTCFTSGAKREESKGHAVFSGAG